MPRRSQGRSASRSRSRSSSESRDSRSRSRSRGTTNGGPPRRRSSSLRSAARGRYPSPSARNSSPALQRFYGARRRPSRRLLSPLGALGKVSSDWFFLLVLVICRCRLFGLDPAVFWYFIPPAATNKGLQKTPFLPERIFLSVFVAAGPAIRPFHRLCGAGPGGSMPCYDYHSCFFPCFPFLFHVSRRVDSMVPSSSGLCHTLHPFSAPQIGAASGAGWSPSSSPDHGCGRQLSRR